MESRTWWTRAPHAEPSPLVRAPMLSVPLARPRIVLLPAPAGWWDLEVPDRLAGNSSPPCSRVSAEYRPIPVGRLR